MSVKKKDSSRGGTVQLDSASEEAIRWVQDWSRYNRKEIVNAAVAVLPRLGRLTAGAMIGSVPEELAPDFAELVLQELRRQRTPELGLRQAASESPEDGGSTPPSR